MILRLDATSALPPYAQLRDQIATMIRRGVLPPDARLPAIRHLANDLGVAPNTVARAYRELEGAGLVAGRGRHGTVVLLPAAEASGVGTAEVEGAAETFATEAAQRGLDLDQALDAVRAAFTTLDERRRFSG